MTRCLVRVGPRTALAFVTILLAFALLPTSCTGEARPDSDLSASPSPMPTLTDVSNPSPLPTATPTMVPELHFDGQLAFDHVARQLEFGPRWPGSQGHEDVGDYIVGTLEELGWAVEEQRFPYLTVEGRNVIGRANEGQGEVIILGAHYDTRKVADQSPDRTAPVPGAVDGASGVAVLLELARTLNLEEIEHEIWLAFFDVEDNGSAGIPDFDWIVGSTYMAENLTISPVAMVLVDMVGDADQQFYFEGNSDPTLQSTIWEIAEELGYSEQFIPQLKYTMIDDHVPFAQVGIPAIDIIDFDYPYWHTVEDTLDKVSRESLVRVGRTLEVWLEERVNE